MKQGVAVPNSEEQTDMKTSLRQGDVKTSNIHTVGLTNFPSLLGYSTFLFGYLQYPLDDGIVVLASVFPGGSWDSFNWGHTTTHKVGH